MVPCSDGQRCPNCCGRWQGDGNCPRCFTWDALDGALAAVDMEGAARKVVHGLKYRYIQSLAPIMAARMASLAPATGSFDLAFPVPLHRSRIRQRGFNQAELLLRLLAWPEGEGALERIRKTDAQVGLRLGERRSNVAGAFRYSGPSLRGASVALLDDVITTGATANECARVLRDYGARSVKLYAFARAHYPTSRDEPIDEWASS
jgi:ComF family protein